VKKTHNLSQHTPTVDPKADMLVYVNKYTPFVVSEEEFSYIV